MSGNPNAIALAFALGAFISITPFYGLHTLIAVIVGYFCRVNIPAIMIGAWLNNPLTAPFVYSGCFYIGRYLIGGPPLPEGLSWHELLTQHLGAFFIQLAIGCTLAGLIASLISFATVRYGIILVRARKKTVPSST